MKMKLVLSLWFEVNSNLKCLFASCFALKDKVKKAALHCLSFIKVSVAHHSYFNTVLQNIVMEYTL